MGSLQGFRKREKLFEIPRFAHKRRRGLLADIESEKRNVCPEIGKDGSNDLIVLGYSGFPQITRSYFELRLEQGHDVPSIGKALHRMRNNFP